MESESESGEGKGSLREFFGLARGGWRKDALGIGLS